MKFHGWPRQIRWHLFYTTPSLVRHFKSIGELKLELQSGNGQFRSKSAIFLSRVTLKFVGWPWKRIRHLFYTASSFVHHFKAIGEFKHKSQYGNPQFRSKFVICFPVWPWNLTVGLTNNRAPALCCLKLGASLHSHQWIQTEKRTDRRTNTQTDWTIQGAPWSQLK